MYTVLCEKRVRIVYITLNRPEKLNAIDEEMIAGVQQSWVNFIDHENCGLPY